MFVRLLMCGAAASTVMLIKKTANASGDALHPPQLPWSHKSYWGAYDHASIRRGFEVYKNVCAACHSLKLVTFRHLINVCFSPEEVKAIAESTDIQDGPNDEGEMFKRPGNITDYLPSPYENDQMARYINNGAVPPDQSLIIKARHDGANYVYAILTGYRDPPAGVTLREGAHYNPYFAGGTISMAQALMNGMVEYQDGTKATISQMAKDVTTFLCWAAEPEHDERKLMGLRTLALFLVFLVPMIYQKRLIWAPLKSRMVRFWDPPK